MKTLLLITISLGLCATTQAQYSKKAQASQDALVGTKSWISPPLPMEGSQVVYKGTEPAGRQTRETLFNNALEWYSYNYKTADTRLSVENAEAGLISGTGVIKYNPAAAGLPKDMPIFFTFDIVVRDGEYSYKVYDLYGLDQTGRFSYADMYREDRNTPTQLKPKWDKRYRYEMLSDVNTMTEMMIVHLKQAMQMNKGVANN